MSYYLAFPFVFALLAPGAQAGIFFDDERCFNDDGHRIDCPDHKEFEIRRILYIAVPLGLLFLFLLAFSIHFCVKKRRAKNAFGSLDAPGGGPIAPYNVAAPQMEQGYAGQWASPSTQQVPNPFAGGQPYVQQTHSVPAPPPTLAHGGSYNPGLENTRHDGFEEVKINT